jgi:hypothetical protein
LITWSCPNPKLTPAITDEIEPLSKAAPKLPLVDIRVPAKPATKRRVVAAKKPAVNPWYVIS